MVIKKPISHRSPSVSVVIPTVPDRELLVLPFLGNQSVGDFEIIVVKDPSLNISEARNVGLHEANGQIVAHTDDDCRIPPKWIQGIKRSFRNNPKLKLVEGGLMGYFTAPRHYLGANIAYQREAGLEIGGFDPAFAGWREDTDFGWRMEDRYGLDACAYVPDLEIEHIGPPQSEEIETLEHRFRTRYPQQTFDLLYCPETLLGQFTVTMTKLAYTHSPKLGLFLCRLNPKM